MKKIIYIIFFTTLFAQTSSSSMYGFGEYINSFDASSVAMGDGKYFGTYSNRIVFSSPSSYWKSSFSNLMMSVSTNINEFSNNNLIENNFRMFAFTFPVGDSKMCSFGMNPLIRSELNLTESRYKTIGADQSPTDDPIAYNTEYDFSGGISEFFILFSSKLSNNISFGFRWSKLFGTSKNKYYLSLYDIIVNADEDGDPNPQYSFSSSDLYIDKNKYSSSKYLIEFRFEYDKVSSVLSYGESQFLNIEHTPYYCGILSNSSCENYYEEYDFLLITDEYLSNNKMVENGLGLKYDLNDKLSIIYEHHDTDVFSAYEFLNIFENNNPNIKSDHLGLCYKFNNDINSIVNQTIVKLGLFNKTNTINAVRLFDRGITMGFGMNYFDNKSFIDLSFKMGYKSTEYSNLDDEKYYMIMLTLSGGEKWFMNERNK